MHGSGRRLVNTTDGVQLELERKAAGSGNINFQVFVISDAQFNILGNQLDDVHYRIISLLTLSMTMMTLF